MFTSAENVSCGRNFEHSPQSPQTAFRRTSSADSLLGQAFRPGHLTFLNGLALVVGLQIGSGIFSAPSQVSQHVLSPGIGVIAWSISGLVVWTGASSFIELGLAIIRNGGAQEYLRYCYGDFMGFVFTWTWVAIVKPSSIAIVGTVFADHLCTAILPTRMISKWLIKLVAVLGIAVITCLNCTGRTVGAKAANCFLVLKLITLFSIAAIGFGAGLLGKGEGVITSEDGWFGVGSDGEPLQPSVQIGNFVTALLGALWCYGGWETIGFVAGDMADPKRDLPLVLNSAMVIVITGFVSMNVSLYLILPMDVMRSKITLTSEFGKHLFGPIGGLTYSLAIAASAMGALNANLFVTATLCVAASQQGFLPSILSNMHYNAGVDEGDYYRKALKNFPVIISAPAVAFAQATAPLRLKRNIPIYALLLNAFVSSFYVIIGTFNGLIAFVGLTEYFFFFFSVLGIFILRRSHNRTDTSQQMYRTWTANAIIFCVGSSFIVLRGVITDPLQGLAIFGVMCGGWVIYTIRFRRTQLS